MTNLVFNFDPDKKKKYVHFWIYAILSGLSFLLQTLCSEIASMFCMIFALAAIVVPILMAMDEKNKS
jgi:hypothetical protein